MNKLLVVCGPTATGKTALAVELAKQCNGELVSADSRQVYRGMDIGTGKDVLGKSKIKNQKSKIYVKNKIFEIVPYDVNGIPLWMVDVVNPDEEFSVAHYQKLAAKVIEDIEKRGKLAIIVGGTGLYIASLLSPLETSHIPPNNLLRNQLQMLSKSDLQKRLQKEHPSFWEAMNESDRQNPRRLIRKIEITEFSSCHPALETETGGKNLDSRLRGNDKLDILLVGITATNSILYQRIDERVEKRVKQGVIGEIAYLLKKGYSWGLPSMNTFGYKEWKEYFLSNQQSAINKSSIIKRWKWDEHGYARRQMTWFGKMKDVHWFNIAQSGWQEKVETLVASWYTK